ncbi:MAG: hypothetical protein IIW98_01650, partial [Bacteroidaceae bacterium]|nr:hypothetical protein [Bacteroidaceae bacterium]
MKKLLFTLLLAVAVQPSWALIQENGVYKISTAQDLVDFATLVNGGTGNANAVLTTDIDMTGITSWTPIGQDGKD